MMQLVEYTGLALLVAKDLILVRHLFTDSCAVHGVIGALMMDPVPLLTVHQNGSLRMKRATLHSHLIMYEVVFIKQYKYGAMSW